MKKFLAIVFTAVIGVTAFGLTPASAAYLPEYDKTISIQTDQDLSPYLNEDTAKLSFELQEALIAEYERTTGTTFDHYYYWIEVNGTRVLGIDPPVAMY